MPCIICQNLRIKLSHGTLVLEYLSPESCGWWAVRSVENSCVIWWKLILGDIKILNVYTLIGFKQLGVITIRKERIVLKGQQQL